MDRLIAHGVTNIVVNVHHLSERIAECLKGRARIVHEERLLGTGGSVVRALPLLGNGPFFVLNGDGLWRERSGTMLERLEMKWASTRIDALLLLHPIHKVFGREATDRGDFFIERGARVRHRGVASLAPYVFASASVCDARLLEDATCRFGVAPSQLVRRQRSPIILRRRDPCRPIGTASPTGALAHARRGEKSFGIFRTSGRQSQNLTHRSVFRGLPRAKSIPVAEKRP
jgi:NDP-sugar pyrophosphorylase family protein